MQQTKVMIANHEGDAVEVGLKALNNMKSDQVYIIQSDDQKTIFLWNGSKASPRNKFIGSRLATEIRMTLGLTYRVKSEDEGYETTEFQGFKETLGLASEKVKESEERIESSEQQTVKSIGFVDREKTQRASSKTQPSLKSKSVPLKKKSVPVNSKVHVKKPVPVKNGNKTIEDKSKSIESEIPIEPSLAKIFWPLDEQILSKVFDVSYMQKKPQKTARRIIDGRNHQNEPYTVLTLTITANEKPVTVTLYDTNSVDLTRDKSDLIPRMHFKVPEETSKALPLAIRVEKGRSVYFTSTTSCFINLIGINL